MEDVCPGSHQFQTRSHGPGDCRGLQELPERGGGEGEQWESQEDGWDEGQWYTHITFPLPWYVCTDVHLLNAVSGNILVPNRSFNCRLVKLKPVNQSCRV